MKVPTVQFRFVWMTIVFPLICVFNNCGPNLSEDPSDKRLRVELVDDQGATFHKLSSYKVINGKILIDSDIIVGDVTDIDDDMSIQVQAIGLQLGKTPPQRALHQAMKIQGGRFPNGKIFYEIADTYSDRETQILSDLIIRFNNTMIEKNINLQYVARNGEPDYVELAANDLGCSSTLGYFNRKMTINLEANCLNQSVFFHETMHRLGFIHEHQRPDRDTYIQVFPGNVDVEQSNGIRDPLQPYSTTQVFENVTRYDYKSITHYGSRQLSTNGMKVVFQRWSPDSQGSMENLGNHTFSDMDSAELFAIYGGFGGNPPPLQQESVPNITITNVTAVTSTQQKVQYATSFPLDFSQVTSAMLLIRDGVTKGDYSRFLPFEFPLENLSTNSLGGSVTVQFDINPNLYTNYEMAFLQDGEVYAISPSFTLAPNALPLENPNPCIDTDGDGYGWDGTQTCAMGQTSTPPPQAPPCLDADGDGYGWDGTQSCIIDDSKKPVAQNNGPPCIDSDGDGFGWDGTKTCTP